MFYKGCLNHCYHQESYKINFETKRAKSKCNIGDV